MDDYIPRKEHEEFCKRMEIENKRLEDEDDRQNQRIKILEQNVSEIREISASIKELAVNMQGMLKEQEKQGKRLETLEGRDGEMWRKVVGYVITAVIGIVVGYIFTQVGM